MAKQLSERETAVLKAILQHMPRGATGRDLDHQLFKDGFDSSPAGCHRTAASLCRKNLAWRAGTPKQQRYAITQPGRDALDGNVSGQWIARKESQ
jgi:hypothetical protein